VNALQQDPNRWARWFSRVAWLGIVFNLAFVAAGIFAPNLINVQFDVPITGVTAWNVAHAAMVLALTLLYIPAALSPLRYPAYTWMIVVSRFVAVACWASLMKQDHAFVQALLPDAMFGVFEGILLHKAMPEEGRISVANLSKGVKLWFARVGLAFHRPAVRVVTVLVVLLLVLAGYAGWYNLVRAEPDAQIADNAEHYKYGAIGLGSGSRIPYWIWKVMPEMFSDKLPTPGGGWASLGMIYEDGHDLPVGFSKRHIGFDSVEPNCSLCHVGLVRSAAGAKPMLIPGGPANTLDLQGWQRFMYSSAADPRFNPSNVIAEINKIHKLGLMDTLLYRFIIIPMTKEGLMEQQVAYAWQNSRPAQGRGRTDTFNPTKFNVFHLPDDGTIGTVDLPQVWNQQPRDGMHLHWDGNNTKVTERNFAAAMAIGATPKSVILPSFAQVTDYIYHLRPAAYPFPIDQASAARGEAVYAQNCASCHAFGGAKTGTVTDISMIGTDRHRLDSFSPDLVNRFHSINQPPFVFDAYSKTNGYANVPLDGIWARGPYLHNGSVPNLRSLLMPVQSRPATFYAGYDVYDPVNVGFVTDGPDAQKHGSLLDVNVAGNSNAGHTYGVNLSDADKKDLLEYLKKL
jgi:hypothetical protein